MFKKGGLGWTIWNVLLGVLLGVVGVLSCAFSGDVNFQKAVILVIGILVIVDAGFRLLLQVVRIFSIGHLDVVKVDYGNAAIGASELAIGILLIFVQNEFDYANIVFRYIAYFVGILLITVGVVGLIYGIFFLVRKANSILSNILGMLVACLGIVLGIVVIIYLPEPKAALQVFFVLTGITFIAGGLVLLISAIYIGVRMRKDRKALEKEGK